jgi:hypothetical protein
MADRKILIAQHDLVVGDFRELGRYNFKVIWLWNAVRARCDVMIGATTTN